MRPTQNETGMKDVVRSHAHAQTLARSHATQAFNHFDDLSAELQLQTVRVGRELAPLLQNSPLIKVCICVLLELSLTLSEDLAWCLKVLEVLISGGPWSRGQLAVANLNGSN